MIQKTLYLINTKEYPYHKNIVSDFTKVIPGEVIDMSQGSPLHEIYYEIEKKSPNVVITFDLAGFELRTGSDTLSLNGLYARMAHIIFSKKNVNSSNLKLRQNLSMFTYIPEGIGVDEVKRTCPEVPNISNFVQFIYRADNVDEHEMNQNSIRRWWDDFKRDAML